MAKKTKNSNIVTLKNRKKLIDITSVDFILLFSVLVLLVIGLTMLYSTTSAANMYSGNVYGPIIRQSAVAFVGLCIMIYLSQIDYRKIKGFTGILYIGVQIAMVLVAFIGVDSHGARRQISLPFLGSIQPSEFSKYIMILYLAAQFSLVKKGRIKEWPEFFTHVAIVAIPVAICVGLQRHASAALIHLLVGGVMLIAVGTDWKKLIPTGALGLGVLFVIIMATGFRVDRITGFLNQSADAQGNNWQAIQGIYAVGSGGLFGLGLGGGRQKYSYLPEAENDYIFAIVAEELGFIGAVIVVVLFCVVIWRGITIAINSRDAFGTYTAFGVSVLLGFQVLINMCVVLRLIPSTGMQLPLFSQGGSNMLVTLIGVGLLLSISKYNKKK